MNAWNSMTWLILEAHIWSILHPCVAIKDFFVCPVPPQYLAPGTGPH